jgi:hypothetical protein
VIVALGLASSTACLLLDPFPGLAAAPDEDAGSADAGKEDAGGSDTCSPGAKRPCSRVACRGEQRCEGDGRWGPCDARDASVEKCSTTLSESCIGDGGCTGDPTWGRALGDGTTQDGVSVAVDATGHIYVAGTFTGSIPQLDASAVAGSTKDSFVAKLTAEGAIVWGRQLAHTVVHEIALGKTGIVVGGTLTGTTTLPGCPTLSSAGSSDIVIVRYDADGGCVAAKTLGDSSVQILQGLAVDRVLDDVLIAGRITGTVGFDSPDGGVVLSTTGADGFYARLDPTLHGKYAKFVPSTGRLLITGVTASPGGTAVVFGTFSGELMGEPAERIDDGFTMVIKPNGTIEKVSTLGWPIIAGAFDASNRMLLLGTFDGVMDLRKISGQDAGPRIEARRPGEPFVIRRLVTELPKIEAFGLDDPIIPTGVSADAEGQVIVVGRYAAPDAGPGPSTDVFVGKYDEPSLAKIWWRVFGNGLQQQGNAVAADPFGSVVVAGTLRGTIKLGPADAGVSAAGPGSVNGDALVLKLAP